MQILMYLEKEINLTYVEDVFSTFFIYSCLCLVYHLYVAYLSVNIEICN